MDTGSPDYRAERLSAVRPSIITEIAELARQMRAEERTICNLSVGEPDFPTDSHICDAANDAMKRGDTRYPRTQGSLRLVAAIIARHSQDYGTVLDRENILVANGAKQILFNAFFATLNTLDEVIVPAPYWTTYPDIIRLCGGTVIHTRPSGTGSFQPDVAGISENITGKTKWILLNSPSNPSGAVVDDTIMDKIFALLRENTQVSLMCDEIYDKVLYDGCTFRSALAAAPDLADRILVINGVSKTYAMTGWRIGYGIGPARLISAMTDIQGQSTSGACSIAQAAAAAALEAPQDQVESRRTIYQERRDIAVGAIADMPRLDCFVPAGAFYVLMSIEGLVGKEHPTAGSILDGPSFCKGLLRACEVAMVPGEAFGVPNYARLSFACGADELREAMRRLAAFAEQCK